MYTIFFRHPQRFARIAFCLIRPDEELLLLFLFNECVNGFSSFLYFLTNCEKLGVSFTIYYDAFCVCSSCRWWSLPTERVKRAGRLESFELGVCVDLFVKLVVVLQGGVARLVQCLVDVLGREATTETGIRVSCGIREILQGSTYTSTFSLISTADLS